MGFLDIIPIVGHIIDKIIPDPQAAAAAKLEMLKLQISDSEFVAKLANDVTTAQVGVNATEAASSSVFVSGWRPCIGWVCGAAFACNYVVVPFAVFISNLFGHTLAIPHLDMSEIMPVLLGMLGLGALRTTEKIKGVAR